MEKILILGAGAMGSAFAFPCADNGHQVSLIGTHLENEFINAINKKKKLHPSLNCNLPTNVEVERFEKFNDIVKNNVDLIVIAVNSKGIDWVADTLGKKIRDETPILLLTKGLSLINNKYKTLAEKLDELLLKNGQKKTPSLLEK